MCDRLTTLGRHICPNKILKHPIKVTVTGAAGNIGYALCFMVAQGRLFGNDQPVSLTLLEIPQMKGVLEGVMMEIRDCAFPLVAELKGAVDYKEGFTGCEVAILVGAKPRGPGMERKDLLGQNALIFKGQGQALNQYADKNCKVVVVGNPANTNALIASHFAPSIPKENFTALTRLDQNRALYQIADRLKTDVRNVRNIIIWGNHSSTQYPDCNAATVFNFPKQGYTSTVKAAVCDDKWLETEFITTVALRGAAIIKQRKLSSAASAASSVCDHIHDWLLGTQSGEFVSMGVLSKGEYGVPKGLIFSFPCVANNGRWEIVEGFKWSEFSKSMIEKTTKELMEERDMAFDYLSKNSQ